MSSVIVLSGILTIALLIQGSYSEKTIELVKAQKTPNSDSSVIDYGSMRITKQSKDSKHFTISGSFQVMHDLQEEELGYSVFHKPPPAKEYSVTPRLQKYNIICEFMKEDTMFYPSLKAASNLPEPETCPFPKGTYTIKDYTISTEKMTTYPAGDYKIMLMLKKHGKFVAGYELYFTIKL